MKPVSAHVPGGIPEISGIELRMLPPFIRNNHTPKIWPFPGRARLYCLTMVVSDVANQLNGYIDLNSFGRIGSGELLPVNKTLYYWERDSAEATAPNQLHVVCSVIKGKGALRDVGAVLGSAREDQEYRRLVDRLGAMVADTASVATVVNLALQITGVVGRYLGHVSDQSLGTMVRSFTRLHGDWDKPGIVPLTVPTRDVDFSLELVVRNKHQVLYAPDGGLLSDAPPF